MLRSRERFDGSVLDRHERIWNDEPVIDPDGIPESLAGWTRSEWGVKAEQLRLGLFVLSSVVFADVAIGEFKYLGAGVGRLNYGRVPLSKADLKRVNQALADLSGGLQSVDEDVGSVEISERIILRARQLNDLAVSKKPRETLLKKRDKICRY